MDIKTNIDGQLATISVEGKLTVATSPELEAAVRTLPEPVDSFDIDLSKLDYVSSAGLRVLVTTQKLAHSRGGDLRLLHPTPNVQDVFEMTGLSEIMTVVS